MQYSQFFMLEAKCRWQYTQKYGENHTRNRKSESKLIYIIAIWHILTCNAQPTVITFEIVMMTFVPVIVKKYFRWYISAYCLKGTPIQFETGILEYLLHRCAFIGASAQLIQWSYLLLQFFDAWRKLDRAAKMYKNTGIWNLI